jgi:hypothetical protein
VSSIFCFDPRDFSRVMFGLRPTLRCCAGSDKLASGIDFGAIAGHIETNQ